MSGESSGGAKAGGLDPQLLSACIHCGLCLPACPTYVATGREMESPRGRIYLLNLFQSGEEELTPRMREHLESCLGCLGCETACPSGVQYGQILDQARPLLAEKRPASERKLMRFAFAKVLPNYPLLRRLGGMLRLWQRTKGRSVLQKLLPPLPMPVKETANHLSEKPASFLQKIVTAESFLPEVPKFLKLPLKSWRAGPKLGNVQLFAGCVMDIFYNHVNHAAIRLLNRQSQIVEVPPQTCCGALAYHAGEEDITRRLAAENIELFEKHPGPILVTSAGCGAMLKHYGHLFADADDVQMRQKAAEFSGRVQDVTEFLAEHDFDASRLSKGKPHAIAYHAACHLAHAQQVRSAPEKLLKDLVENSTHRLIALQEAEHCCGSAGIFNVINPDMSLKVLDRKMRNIKATGADVVVTTNPGCLLQLEYGARQCAQQVRVSHLVQFLDECMGGEEAEESEGDVCVVGDTGDAGSEIIRTGDTDEIK